MDWSKIFGGGKDSAQTMDLDELEKETKELEAEAEELVQRADLAKRQRDAKAKIKKAKADIRGETPANQKRRSF